MVSAIVMETGCVRQERIREGMIAETPRARSENKKNEEGEEERKKKAGVNQVDSREFSRIGKGLVGRPESGHRQVRAKAFNVALLPKIKEEGFGFERWRVPSREETL